MLRTATYALHRYVCTAVYLLTAVYCSMWGSYLLLTTMHTVLLTTTYTLLTYGPQVRPSIPLPRLLQQQGLLSGGES